MWWKTLMVGLWLVAGASLPGRGQGVGSWERTDLFGNPNSTNVPNYYAGPLVHNGTITLGASASSLFGYWVQYDLLGNRKWQKRGRGTSSGLVDVPWRNGVFTFGVQAANNLLGVVSIYHWLNANGDTVRVLGRPAIDVSQHAAQALAQHGRYYVAGSGDGSGTGQRPLALHYSLVCLDTAGRLRWQRQYPNPAIRLGPTNPAFVGGYAYLWQVSEAPGPRPGLLLLGVTQRDSANFQLYVLETDTAGQLRRARWVQPFGRRADVQLGTQHNVVRLRDGSGYVLTGTCRLDSLTRTRERGFVARLDTALRVVWRTLLPAPTAAGPADPTADVLAGQVRERADGGFSVMVTERFTNGHPRLRRSEFDLVRLSAGGRVLGWDAYCSQVCSYVEPYAWQYLAADSSVVVSGWGEQRNASTGRVVAQPGWLARLAAPCRRYAVPAVPTAAGRSGAGGAGLAFYPQPARAGQAVQVPGLPGGGSTGLRLRLVDVLGRVVAELVLAPDAGTGAAGAVLPAGLGPGLYGAQVWRGPALVATRKLLVAE